MKCLDTYSLVEIHNGNPQFAKILNDKVAITEITMSEFYGYLYQKHNEKTADYWLRKLSFYLHKVPIEVLVKAVKYRIDNKKQKLSFFDCAGYVFAVENDMVFLTGNKEFKNKKGAEFLKSENPRF